MPVIIFNCCLPDLAWSGQIQGAPIPCFEASLVFGNRWLVSAGRGFGEALV